MTGHTSLGEDEIVHRFGYHKATPETAPDHQAVRALYSVLAHRLDELLPPGRAKSVAITELETSCMWANKAISEQAPIVSE